jgi:hypothetical protein
MSTILTHYHYSRYGAGIWGRRVLLFGSCLNIPEEEGNDIDLAVAGLLRCDYRKFGSELLWTDELKGKVTKTSKIAHWQPSAVCPLPVNLQIRQQ